MTDKKERDLLGDDLDLDDDYLSDNDDNMEETLELGDEDTDMFEVPDSGKGGPDSVREEISGFAGDIPVQVVAVMGKKSISMKDLTELKVGDAVNLERSLNESVDIVANGKLIARGELVDIDGQMGVRIVKMVR